MKVSLLPMKKMRMIHSNDLFGGSASVMLMVIMLMMIVMTMMMMMAWAI